MTNTKNKTFVECVTKNNIRLIYLTNQSEIFHRAASKVFSGCLSSTPIPLLLTDTQLTLLKIILKLQALSCFQRALRLLPESFNLSALGSKSVISRLKKKPLLVMTLRIHSRDPSILTQAINYMPSKLLWTPIKFTVSYSIPNCSGPNSSHLEYAKNRLLSLPPSDAYVWSDSSVPFLTRRVALECMPCNPNARTSTLFLCWTNCLQFHS